MFCHPFLDGPILRLKCSMPLGISTTTKAYLLAGKHTFSYFMAIHQLRQLTDGVRQTTMQSLDLHWSEGH